MVRRRSPGAEPKFYKKMSVKQIPRTGSKNSDRIVVNPERLEVQGEGRPCKVTCPIYYIIIVRYNNVSYIHIL